MRIESLDMSWYSGSLSEYNKIVTRHKNEEMKKQILLVPAHQRVREFGKDVLVKLNIHFTERRIYV